MSQLPKCQATTDKGTQCSRNALSNEIYCTQHLKIYEPALIPDITKNILSEYLEYQEAKDLEPQNLDIYARPGRIEIKENLIDEYGYKYNETYIDGKLTKKEGWWP